MTAQSLENGVKITLLPFSSSELTPHHSLPTLPHPLPLSPSLIRCTFSFSASTSLFLTPLLFSFIRCIPLFSFVLVCHPNSLSPPISPPSSDPDPLSWLLVIQTFALPTQIQTCTHRNGEGAAEMRETEKHRHEEGRERKSHCNIF